MELLHRVVLESPTTTNTVSSITGTERFTDHRMSSQKRLLSDEYGINFPSNKTGRQKSDHCPSTATSTRKTTCSSSAGTCASSFPSLSSQETHDFRLALKLQHEEMEFDSPATLQIETKQQDTAVEDVESTVENCETESEKEMEFEANAAAALLQLQQRKSK